MTAPNDEPSSRETRLKRKDRAENQMKVLVDLPAGSSEQREIDSEEILGPVILPCYYEAGALTNKDYRRSPTNYVVVGRPK